MTRQRFLSRTIRVVTACAFLFALGFLVSPTTEAQQSEVNHPSATAFRAPGSGSPLFLPAVAYDMGAPGAGSVVSADLNGDGKPDMVVTTSDSVGVLLGNGDGTFRPVVAYPLVGGGAEVAVADVNGDGKPDLVVATAFGTNGDGAAQVLLGNGDGTFQPAVSYDSGGPYTYSIAVGDFNGDGKLDLVVADCSPYTGSACGLFGILLGNGDGTFKPVVTYSSGGVGAWSLTVADVNGDGKADLVIGNLCADASCLGNGVVAVLLGKGDGTFQAPVTYGSGGRTLGPVVADVNGDGKPDIVVANGSGSSGVGILLGNGDGTFRPVVTYPVSEEYVSALAVADVNGDGKPDVVVSDCASGRYTCGTNASVSVLLGNGNGTFQPALTFSSGGADSIGIALADVNGDGRPDILVANCAPDGGGCNGSMNGVVGVLLNNTVPENSTTTKLISSLNPSTYGQSVTWTATVTGSGSTPLTGKVNFTWDIYTIGSATLNSSGVASFTRSNLNADSYPLTAVYLGDANNLGSTSLILNQVVTEATSSATLTSSPNPSTSGEAVTFTATITSPTVKPAGPVTFALGKTVLGTAELSGGKAKFISFTLPVGSDVVTATYYGDSNISQSSASVTQTVSGSVIPPVFTMPYNGTLYLLQEGGSASATTEFGLGTTTANFVPYYTGLPNNPNPVGEVTVGYFAAGTVINFGMFTQWGSQSGWAFSTGTDEASIVAFTDTDDSLGMGGSITQQTSSTTWLLHLDDALSYLYDDDDNDVLMQIRVAPSSPRSAQKPGGVKPAR